MNGVVASLSLCRYQAFYDSLFLFESLELSYTIQCFIGTVTVNFNYYSDT